MMRKRREQERNRFFPTFAALAAWLRERKKFPGDGDPELLRSSERWTAAKPEVILQIVAFASKHHQPLVPLLKDYAIDATQRDRARILQLAELLESGVPLADALEQNPRLTSASATLAVRSATEAGTLESTLHALLEDNRIGTNIRTDAEGNWAYLSVVAVVIAFLIAFLALKIAPTLDQLLRDTGGQWPTILDIGLNVGQWALAGAYIFLLVAAVIALASLIRRPWRLGVNNWLIRLLRPGTGDPTADVLQSLSITSAAGRPLVGTVSTLARFHYVPSIRRRLLFVRNEMEHGIGIWSSMQAARLLNAKQAKLLETSERVGNCAWVLRQLSIRQRIAGWKRGNVVRQLMFPLCTMALGMVVLWVGSVLFSSMAQLVNAVS